MILNALALKLKKQARGDFRGRHFKAVLIDFNPMIEIANATRKALLRKAAERTVESL